MLTSRPEIKNALLAIAMGLMGAFIVVLITMKLSSIMALGAILGLVFCIILVYYPPLGLYCTALVVPLERLGRFTDDSSMFTISIMRMIGVVTLMALMVHFFYRKKTFYFGTTLTLYCLYLGFCVLSLTHTSDLKEGIRSIAPLLGNALFFFLIINLIQTHKSAVIAVILWLIASIGVCLYSTYDWHFGSGIRGGMDTEQMDPGQGLQRAEDKFNTVWQDQAEWQTLGDMAQRRSMGTTSHAAVYGINLIMTIPFFFYFLRQRQHFMVKAFTFGGLGLVFYNILLTNTRANLITAVGVVGYCVLRQLYRITPIQIILGIAAIPLVMLMIPADVYNRILDISNYTTEKSAALRIRLDYWDAGFRVIQDYLFSGAGIGNSKIIPQYVENHLVPNQTTVHNIYIQTMIDVGIFGWFTFFSFVGLLFLYCRKSAKTFQRAPNTQEEYWFMIAVEALMVGVLVFGLQVDVFHFPLKGWWLVAGLCVVMYRLSQTLSPSHVVVKSYSLGKN